MSVSLQSVKDSENFLRDLAGLGNRNWDTLILVPSGLIAHGNHPLTDEKTIF